MNNGLYSFEVSFFVSEIFEFLCYANCKLMTPSVVRRLNFFSELLFLYLADKRFTTLMSIPKEGDYVF